MKKTLSLALVICENTCNKTKSLIYKYQSEMIYKFCKFSKAINLFSSVINSIKISLKKICKNEWDIINRAYLHQTRKNPFVSEKKLFQKITQKHRSFVANFQQI